LYYKIKTKMDMKKGLSISVKYLVLSLLFLTLAFSTSAGFLQNYIYFADPLNELAFFTISLVVGFYFGLLAFGKE